MKIIHTADLHLGQVIYQHYGRSDEHKHFIGQLGEWCRELRPDALVVAGDVFDIQQPSAEVWRQFTDDFVELRRQCPEMKIVVVAGNHDSASRVQSHAAVWEVADTRVVGIAPPYDWQERSDRWEERFVVRIPAGYIIAMPYMSTARGEVVQHLLDYVGELNVEGKPVVITGHLAVTGTDFEGHDVELGRIRTQDIAELGHGYDYCALGHIHKPQTINHREDMMKLKVSYPAPVARYSGSALHVSCDEQYPHSVSLVEIDRHGGTVNISQLRIDQLRHFVTLPEAADAMFADHQTALDSIREYIDSHKGSGNYLRLAFDVKVDIPADFHQRVYDLIKDMEAEVRYNRKFVWRNLPEINDEVEQKKPTFEVAELQEMTDPMKFIEKTIDDYPEFDADELKACFDEIRKELDKNK